jgi:rubrerythrin
MNPKQVSNCPECGYEANAPNATRCAICDAPLGKEVGKAALKLTTPSLPLLS